MATVTGRVVDEAGTALPDLTVEARGDWLLTSERLASDKTDKQGHFKLEVPDLLDITDLPRPFRLRVLDVTKRPLIKERELGGDPASQDLGDITVQRADLDGLLVTNLTGAPKFVSEGNAIRLLIDGGEAFGRIADDIRGATHSVNMTQLFFALPPEFHQQARDEKPALVFKFLEPPLVPIDPLDPNPPAPAPRVSDDRPERLLIDAAQTSHTIRILLNEPGLGFPEGIFWLGVLTPLAAGLGVGGVAGLGALVGIGIPFFPIVLGITVVAFFAEYVLIRSKLEDVSDVHKTRKYFGQALADQDPGSQRITVRGFRQPAPQNGVLHCKMVITDDKRAVVVGSPFSQRYFDFFDHRIDDPHRGSNTSDMVHDLSIAVVGPAVHDLYDTFRLYWNEDVSAPEKLPDAPVPAAESSGEDAVSKLQVTRTLSGGRFSELGGTSEKGILESYLRAFASAKKYIYLENQYFTDSVITDALCEVLRRNTQLELILVVPLKPDVIFYPRRSAWRIKQLRAAGGNRVGVFTRWSYSENHPRPWVAPIYIHAKGAVVDDSWATVGSANLDGLSLDYNLLLSPLVFGETTAAELNISVIPPTPGAVTPFAELMRRRLFAEHLGLVDADGNPNPDHERLGPARPDRWLDLWNPLADGALAHLKLGKREPLPGFVLKYPAEDGGWLDTPRKHLAALGVNLKLGQAVVRPITGTRGFDFFSGKWSKTPEHEDLEGAAR
jgi:phosphatidylserine/phosphatidylglycerophosphate/cardiolipin synthase-like enzyme